LYTVGLVFNEGRDLVGLCQELGVEIHDALAGVVA